MDISDLYASLGKEELRQYIKNKQEENLSLEFKEVSDAGFASRDDRRNFAKALSGFANSAGGLVVWGIKATKNRDGIDCACGSKEIEPLSGFLARLNALTGELVCPIVEGVKHRKIVTTDDTGIAVTVVPESIAGPHMAKGGVDRYYKRSGDSFYRMEHFDIEDMFGRRKKPRLSLYTRIAGGGGRSGGGRKTTYICHIILGIKNVGRGTAKYPYLAVKVHDPYKIDLDWGLDGNGNHGLPILPKGSGRSEFIQFGANADIVIHPSTTYEVTRIRFEIADNSEKVEDVVIESRMVAEDMKDVEETTVIRSSEIIEHILPEVDSDT